jgi:signal transduction histidine kinase
MTGVYFIYGLAFFTFGVAVLAKGVPAVTGKVVHGIKYVAIFGLIHSVTEWSGMAKTLTGDSLSLAILDRTALISGAASFAFLLYGGFRLNGFGSRLANRAVFLSFGVWALFYLGFEAGAVSYCTADMVSRYIIGVPGALITAYALQTTVRVKSVALVRQRYSRDLSPNLWNAESLRPLFTATAAFFALYGILTAVVEPGDFLPANVINTTTFHDMFGFHVQFARMLTAAGMTTCFLIFLSYFNTLERLTLEEEVALRTRDATEALAEAEQASQAKSEFLATMSHELRTPLNAILGFSDIISHQYLGPHGEKKYMEYAEDIHSSGEHLLELVNDLLDISAIEAGKQSLNKEMLTVNEMVAESFNAVGRKAQEKDIELLTEISETLPPLYADKRAIRQILLNLLTNAVKFTLDGGRITVSAKAAKQKIILKVADTGQGIPAERLPNLTEPFTKGAVEPHKTVDGWGLGLAITKSLIDLHDGKLDIASKVGKGTTVRVTLPNTKACYQRALV